KMSFLGLFKHKKSSTTTKAKDKVQEPTTSHSKTDLALSESATTRQTWKSGPITAIVIGCGQRGRCYSEYALIRPNELQIVAAADPRATARSYMSRTFGLANDAVFEHWQPLVEKGRIADAAIICTQDQQHLEPCQACKRLGCHVLLEKPMACSPLDCARLVHREWLSEPDQLMVICHVLRYLPAVRKIHQFIRSGQLGRLCHVQHTEPVGYAHFAHSYVRGNWRNEAGSAFSLLTKCCHDVDLICYWMPSRCSRVSSFGSLVHFRPEEKPEGAAERCVDCSVEKDCPYSAVKAYIFPGVWSPAAFVDREACNGDHAKYQQLVEEAVKTGPYGRCVYNCDNDVCDHQVVNMEFDDGATASLTMMAFTEAVCVRSSVFYGTRGELRWNGASYGDTALTMYEFASMDHMHVPVGLGPEGDNQEAPPAGSGRMRGHGSADFFLAQAFVRALLKAKDSAEAGGDTAGSSLAELQRELNDSTLYGHLVAFAAEESRKRGTVVSIGEYIDSVMSRLDEDC
ncbi:hypothetical protein BOX15_Mlig033406g1, partial [Macrostomum lignano]